MKTEQDTGWLDWSRIFATIAVVVVHASSSVVVDSRVGSAAWWTGNIYDSLAHWCVPVFVMISGALLLDPAKEESLRSFYGKRAMRLLIPLLVWSAVFSVWKLVNSPLAPSNDTVGDALSYVLKRFWSGQPYYHLWFVFMLTGLYMFTPGFRLITKHGTRSLQILLAAAALVIAALCSVGPDLGERVGHFTAWFLPYAGYFLLGHIIRTMERPWPAWLSLLCSLLFAGATAFGLYFLAKRHGLNTGLRIYDYTSLTVIPLSICVMMFFRALRIPGGRSAFVRKLSLLTLGVYMLHPLAMELLRRWDFSVLTPNPALMIPVCTAGAIAIAAPVIWLLSLVPYLRRAVA